ncbi:MAG TPA: ATP-binding cassette domain-containing protein [Dermatophilaceae bacterium]|nr:ATP-binding cassette domain-containing protein [Dermatophilaceae bacterium]
MVAEPVPAPSGAGSKPGARVDVEALTWTPLGRRAPVLAGVNLCLQAGERVLLVGPSGAGKSTLLRALAGVLDSVESGSLGGSVLIDGRRAPARLGRVGLLIQDPSQARVAGRVGRDVAFGPENAALPRELIHQRVHWALQAVGFDYGLDHPTSALSGGEAQRLALAGVLALRPGLLLLDEPTTMLDADSAAQVRGAVDGAVRADGATLLVVEHQLDGWIDLVDRLVVLGPDGRVTADGPIRQVLRRDGARLADLGIWVPGQPGPVPLSVPHGLTEPYRRTAGSGLGAGPGSDAAVGSGSGGLLRALSVGLVRTSPRGLRVVRGPRTPMTALAGVDVRVEAGSVHLVRGPSGAGKSSLISVLVGLTAPTSGHVRAGPALSRGLGADPYQWTSPELAARLGWVPQRAEAGVLGATVWDSLTVTATALGRPVGPTRERGRLLMEILGLSGHARQNPYRLSGGEQRRLALASAVLHGPDVLALDEPTAGHDRHTWAATAGLILAARAAGLGVVAATHDDLFTGLADRTMTLRRGRLVGS